MATAGELLGRLAADLQRELGGALLSVSVHGSWVAGDFVDGRSGLGVLAILAVDPDRHMLGRVALVHQRLERDYPQWADRTEADYVSPAAVADALAGGTDHAMLRICPGELLHIGRISQQYMMNWRSAVEHNQVLTGRPPGELLPWIGDDVVREAILDNLRHWPEWSLDTGGAGGEAYAVLTVCRAAVVLNTGRSISKRAAAEEVAAEHPHWAPLIRWARDWWYAGGLTIEPGRRDEVTAFVTAMSVSLAADAASPGAGASTVSPPARPRSLAARILAAAQREPVRPAAAFAACPAHGESTDLLVAFADRLRGRSTPATGGRGA